MSPELLWSIACSAVVSVSNYAVLRYQVGEMRRAQARQSAEFKVLQRDLEEKIEEHRREADEKLDEYKRGTDSKLDDIRKDLSNVANGVAFIKGKMEKRT